MKFLPKKKANLLRKNVRRRSDLHEELMRSVRNYKNNASLPGFRQSNNFIDLKKVKVLKVIWNGLRYVITSVQIKKVFTKSLLAIAVVMVLSGVFYMADGWEKSVGVLTKIEYFHLKNIEITGCKVTDKNQIRKKAGIDYGTSLLSVNKENLAEIISEDPWIASAKVRLQWPDQMIISVKEHAPEALITLGEGTQQKLYYISKYGMPFSEIKTGDELDFPIITGIVSQKELENDTEVKNDIFSFLKYVRRNDPRLPAQDVSEIHVTENEELVVYLVDQPFPIYMGKGSMKGKYRKLLNILGVLYKKHGKGAKIGEVASIQIDYYGDDKALVSLDD